MKELTPAPQVEELPSCYWISYGASLDQIWIWRCVQPGCCWEKGWIVDRERRPPPNPDYGGALHPPCKPTDCHAEGEKVWGRLRLQEMTTPASTEHSRMSLREAPSPGGGVKGERGRTMHTLRYSRGTCLERKTRMPPVTTPAPRTPDKITAMLPQAWKLKSQPRAMQTIRICWPSISSRSWPC